MQQRPAYFRSTKDLKTSNLPNIFNDIAAMTQQINKLKKDRVANIQTLKNSYENILGELVIMRQKINDAYEKLEKNTIAKLDSLRIELSDSIQIDIRECLKHTDEMKSLSNVVMEIGQKDESLSFKSHQKCCKELSASNELVKELREVHEY
ncbi:hypothetical protein DPMN_170105 [Dreissena polymorpha]|uniref:Uncharacterized protein n=1 Tax=Dreissena polymorpha TaxID=45954 RepID=A0A9D4IEA4_DREPO|nr:hypothetical protein DPMN_170105 [Dreissena polymorpha]